MCTCQMRPHGGGCCDGKPSEGINAVCGMARWGTTPPLGRRVAVGGGAQVGSGGGVPRRVPMAGSDGGVRWWRAHSGSAGLEAKTSTRRREPPQRSSIFMSSALRIGGCGLYLSSILVTSCFDQCLFCWLDDTAARMLRNRWQSCGLYMVNV